MCVTNFASVYIIDNITLMYTDHLADPQLTEVFKEEMFDVSET